MVFPILGSGDSTAGYNIRNSLRLDSASSAYLYRDQADPTSEGVIYTISVWNKICFPNGQNATLLEGGFPAGSGASVDETFFMHNVTNKTIFFQDALNDSTVLGKLTVEKFRDVSAWYHFMLSVDTTQNTDTNRFKVYVNGSDVSSTMTGGWPVQNVVHQLNKEVSGANQLEHWIGRGMRGTNYSDMYIADLAFVDGLQLAPSNFGESDEDSGIWKPKQPDVSAWGDNGFFLEFKQTGTGTAGQTTVGADTSANNNHFTTSGIAATDITTDTPTNNFATMNPLDAGTEGVLSEGNCKYTGGTTSGQGAQQMAGGTFGAANGKWYFEVKKKSNDAFVGVYTAIHSAVSIGTVNPFTSGWVNKNHGIYTSDGNARSGNASTSYGSAINDDDIIGVAIDLDNKAIYYSDNGTFMNSGDPTSGASKTGAAANFNTSYTDFWIMGYIGDGSSGTSSVYEFNFGNPIAALSSGNSDANGYGSFEYAPPTGYYACCSKNLAEFG